MAAVAFRHMSPADWPRLKKIYEAGIATGIATFETVAPSWEDWNSAHLQFSRLVSLEDQHITGWAALSPVSGRCVYGGVAEVSLYVDPIYRGRGIGKSLLQNLVTESENNGIWTLQSGLFIENAASLQVHLQSGFRIIGKREKIGKLHDEWKDSLILEKRSSQIGIN